MRAIYFVTTPKLKKTIVRFVHYHRGSITFANMISFKKIRTVKINWGNSFMRKYLVVIFLLFTFCTTLFAQKKFPQNYFRPPLAIPLSLSGSFGELRTGHFHSGIDIKTEGVEGKKVYAVADGYVSRIKISLTGYGKALYITHPNGYVSVYGHLQRFNSILQRFVKQTQYKRAHYLVAIFPKKDRFRVKKGEVIAYTGNTGSSAGPHLHFEIREEHSEHPVNPLLFKSFKVPDKQHPRIVQLAVYPVDDTSLINGEPDTLILPVLGTGKNCHLKGNHVIKLHGRISFGIRTYDLMDRDHNKNGIYNLEIFADSLPVFGLKMDSLSFFTTRYVNSLVDYGTYQKMNRRFIRTEVDSNNRLFNYYHVKNSGIYSFADTLKHAFRFQVEDIQKNKAVLSFWVQENRKPINTSYKKQLLHRHHGQYVRYNKPVHIVGNHFKADFPANSFYRSFYMHEKVTPPLDSSFSPIIVLHNRFIPIQKKFKLSILPDTTVPPRLKSKLYIAKLGGEQNDPVQYTGGQWEKRFLTTRIREFGQYTILADTIPPKIIPLTVPKNKLLAKQKTIQLKISDSQTGIKSFNATVNGKWLLVEYEQKKDLLTYFIDNHLPKGKSKFVLTVTDNVGNRAIYKTTIIR